MLKRKKGNWKNHMFSTGAETGKDYLKFQKDSKEDLKKMCADNNLKLFRFNNGHYFFSAVLTDGENYVYVAQNDVRFVDDIDRVLIRSMKDSKDYTGGRNQFISWENVGEEAVRILERM